MNRVFSIVITEENGVFVAVNPDTDVASQGGTIDEALANVAEALELYFEEAGTSAVKMPARPTMLTTVTV